MTIARTAFEERTLVLLYASVAIQMPHKSPGLARGIATVLLVTAKGLLLGVRPGDYENLRVDILHPTLPGDPQG